MRNMKAIFWKQIKETFKNKEILIQFLMLPIMAVIMENTIQIENMPARFFVTLFAVMFIGMAPLTCMSSLIAEEKEKNTLRVLMMSNVKPMEYLVGVGSYIWVMCMIGGVVFALCGKYQGGGLLKFLGVMALGILLSLLTGAIIGISSKNQMAATSITVPVMMIFSFLPMLSLFNETIEKVARITYSQQVQILLQNVENSETKLEPFVIILINGLFALALFVFFFRKKGLD